MSNELENLERRLADAIRNERHWTNSETRYWCSQFKLLAQDAVQALKTNQVMHTVEGPWPFPTHMREDK